MFDELQIPLPRVIFQDRAQSLINALDDVDGAFSDVPHMLCQRYQNKCVLAWLQRESHGFGGTHRIDGQRVNAEGVNSALTDIYYPLVDAKVEDEFEERLWKLYDRQEPHWREFYRYLVESWIV